MGLARAIVCMIAFTASVSWAHQSTMKSDGTYDAQTIKEVTSLVKLVQVCLEDIEAAKGEVTLVDQQVCGCLAYELEGQLTYREYRIIEKDILYGRDWKESDPMLNAKPHLIEACNWTG